MWFGAMAAGRISSHRPVLCSAVLLADGQSQATEYNINFITLPGFGTGRRITEYRHSRQALRVVGNPFEPVNPVWAQQVLKLAHIKVNMTTGLHKYQLRFFFDYGAGGCLWARNDFTRQVFGIGPIDKAIAEMTGKLSADTLKHIEILDDRYSDYLNKDYPLDPSLWRQAECDDFNQQIDILLNSLRRQLTVDFEIVDEQIRVSEDKDLNEYLKDKKNFRRPS